MMKAFTIQAEEFGEVVFAEHRITASAQFCKEYGEDLGSISAKRAKQFDQYAPGPVPVSALLENGWHFECEGCGSMFNKDEYIYGRTDEDGNDMDEEINAQVWKGSPFCSDACLAAEKERWVAA